MDVGEVERRLEQLPTDREIVFYCTCPTKLRRRKSQKIDRVGG